MIMVAMRTTDQLHVSTGTSIQCAVCMYICMPAVVQQVDHSAPNMCLLSSYRKLVLPSFLPPTYGTIACTSYADLDNMVRSSSA